MPRLINSHCPLKTTTRNAPRNGCRNVTSSLLKMMHELTKTSQTPTTPLTLARAISTLHMTFMMNWQVVIMILPYEKYQKTSSAKLGCVHTSTGAMTVLRILYFLKLGRYVIRQLLFVPSCLQLDFDVGRFVKG